MKMKQFKYISFKRIALFGLMSITAVFTSCESELDINKDPNNPTEVPISTILTAAEVNLAYTIGGEGTRMPANIVQHYGGHRGQPLEYSQFNITPSATDGLWTNAYDVLLDLRTIEGQATVANQNIYAGISQILQAYTFSVATDIFGDIPFSESLKGATNVTPAYDKQETIYPALFTLLDKGIANVKSNTGLNPTTADLIYSGNIAKWESFGNSLKLRLYNHLSKKNPAQALAFLQTNPSLISSSSNNAKVIFGTSASNANPIHQFDVLSGRKDNAVCQTLVEKMKSLNDPRIPLYFNGVTNNGAGLAGQYFGNIPGQDLDDSGENLFSRVGPAYASIDSPVILMSAAEVEFIKAEIYHRANDFVNSKLAYDKAITADFTALGASNALVYLANPLVTYNSTLSRIMEQKWITMFQASYESWVDWRRTGFPTLTAPTVTRTSGVIPRRLPYPQIEINVNGASLAAGPGIPIPFESLKTKVWWDL